MLEINVVQLPEGVISAVCVMTFAFMSPTLFHFLPVNLVVVSNSVRILCACVWEVC